MKINLIYCLLAGSLIFSCKKDKGAGIDTSAIHIRDVNGNPLSGPNDNQWRPQSFSKNEIFLFESLDNVSLSGTTGIEPALPIAAFPNPFNFHFLLFSEPIVNDNSAVVKWVLVNENMQKMLEGWQRVDKDQYIIRISSDGVPEGKHRLYITYSAAGKPHYFTTWGNVQKGF